MTAISPVTGKAGRGSVSGISASVVLYNDFIRVRVDCPVHKTDSITIDLPDDEAPRTFAHTQRVMALANHEREFHA